MGANTIGNVAAGTDVYSAYKPASKDTAAKKPDSTVKADETKADGAVYEKSESESTKKPTYSINKMSSEDRAALVQQLKADQESRQQNLINIVRQMMTGQATAFSKATGSDDRPRPLSLLEVIT